MDDSSVSDNVIFIYSGQAKVLKKLRILVGPNGEPVRPMLDPLSGDRPGHVPKSSRKFNFVDVAQRLREAKHSAQCVLKYGNIMDSQHRMKLVNCIRQSEIALPALGLTKREQFTEDDLQRIADLPDMPELKAPVRWSDDKSDMVSGKLLERLHKRVQKVRAHVHDAAAHGHRMKTVFFHLGTLRKGDSFGLHSLLPEFAAYPLVLVSESCEVVVMNKTSMGRFVTRPFLRDLRKSLTPYPSEIELENVYAEQHRWRKYKRRVVRSVAGHTERART